MSRWPSRGMGCAAVFLLLSACADQHAPASRQPALASTESPPALADDHHQESARDQDSGGELITLPPASEPLTLTRDQALNLLLAHNPELRHRRLEPEVARAAERAEVGRFGAYIDGEFRFDRQRITTRARSTGRSGDDDLLPRPPSAEDIIRELQADSRRIRADISQDFSGQFAVRQSLASGGEVALIAEGLSQQQGEDARTYETGLVLRLDQPLLAGAGSTVARSSVRLAGLVAEASEHEFRAWLQELVARGERAYWQVVRAQAAIGAVESSLAVALQQQEETHQRIERGALRSSPLGNV